MNRRWIHIRDIVLLFFICFILLYIFDSSNKQNDFLSYNSHVQLYSLFSTVKEKNPNQETSISKHNNISIRKFVWLDPQKKRRETSFFIPEQALKEETKKFGINPAFKHPLIREKKGFKIIGRRNYMVNKRILEMVFTIVDYKKVFSWSQKFFPSLTEKLITSANILKGTDPLHKFLCFVQHIKFKKPPNYYKSKFINNFFTPIVCLYEKYGDCDTKSILLAEFLSAIPNTNEKIAILLVREKGLSHALLAVKRNPFPGMTSLFFFDKGYFIALETSSPGWAPGFISKRITDSLKKGNFKFIEL